MLTTKRAGLETSVTYIIGMGRFKIGRLKVFN